MASWSIPSGRSCGRHESTQSESYRNIAPQATGYSTHRSISAESGIPTFRDLQTGLWERFDAQALATPVAFERDPALVTRLVKLEWELGANCQGDKSKPRLFALLRTNLPIGACAVKLHRQDFESGTGGSLC
jgi:hypothetical protein